MRHLAAFLLTRRGAARPHRVQKFVISAIGVVPGAEETFARQTLNSSRVGLLKHVRQSDESSRNESAPTVMFASRLRASPHAVDCDQKFSQKHAAGIDRSRLRYELSIFQRHQGRGGGVGRGLGGR